MGAGAVCSLLVAWSAYGVGVGRQRPGRPAWVGEAWLRATIGVPGGGLGRVLFTASALGLGMAWLGLVVLVRDRPTTRTATIAAIAALWSLPLLVCPPVGSNDVYSYLAHGELAAAGFDPGEVTPVDGLPNDPVLRSVDRVWRTVVSAYGPLATGLSELAVRAADGDQVAAVLLERASAVAGVVVLGIALVSLARRRPSVRAPAVVLAVAVASPLTVVHVIGGAHNEGLMVGLAVAGVAVARVGEDHTGAVRWAWWAAGVVLVGLGAAVKVSVVLVAAYLGWCAPGRGRTVRPIGPRVLTAAIAGALTLGTIQAVALVADRGWGWLGGAGAGGKVLTLLSITATLGYLLADPFFATQREVQQSVIYNVTRGIGVAVSMVVATVLLWRSPRLGLDAVGWALLAVALLGPAVHPWYLVWGLPLLALRHQGRAEPWLLAAAVVATVAARPGGGGAWPNLASQPWRIIVVIVVGAAAALGVRRVSRARARRSQGAPMPDPTPARS